MMLPKPDVRVVQILEEEKKKQLLGGHQADMHDGTGDDDNSDNCDRRALGMLCRSNNIKNQKAVDGPWKPGPSPACLPHALDRSRQTGYSKRSRFCGPLKNLEISVYPSLAGRDTSVVHCPWQKEDWNNREFLHLLQPGNKQ